MQINVEMKNLTMVDSPGGINVRTVCEVRIVNCEAMVKIDRDKRFEKIGSLVEKLKDNVKEMLGQENVNLLYNVSCGNDTIMYFSGEDSPRCPDNFVETLEIEI